MDEASNCNEITDEKIETHFLVFCLSMDSGYCLRLLRSRPQLQPCLTSHNPAFKQVKFTAKLDVDYCAAHQDSVRLKSITVCKPANQMRLSIAQARGFHVHFKLWFRIRASRGFSNVMVLLTFTRLLHSSTEYTKLSFGPSRDRLRSDCHLAAERKHAMGPGRLAPSHLG